MLSKKIKEKKIFYHGFFGNKTEIISKLDLKYNFSPVIINAHRNDIPKLKEFKNTIIVDNFKIRKGDFTGNNFNKIPIDQEIARSLSSEVISYLNTLHDSSGYNFSFQERKNYFYEAASFWYSILKEKKPDYFISFVNPHTSTCFLIYIICKYVLNIKTFFFEVAPILNSNRHLIFSSYDNTFNNYLKNYYESKQSDQNPSHLVDEYISSIKQNKTPKHIVKDYEDENRRYKKFSFFKFLKYLFNSLFSKDKYFYEVDYKINKKSFKETSSKPNKLEHFLFIEKYKKQNANLKKYYNSKIIEPELDEKYLYFASSYQPEARTNAMCKLFEDQIIALKILRKALPKNIKIFYKENPAIFFQSGAFKGSLRRNREYYDTLLEIDNLYFVDSNIDTFKLIEKCFAVSTLAGSVGWEAIVKNKPALVFGHSWYTMCKSIFHIETLSDCKNAVDSILKGYKPNYNDLVRYCNSIEHCSYEVNIKNFGKLSIGSNEFETEVEKFSYALYDNIRKNENE